MNINKNHIKFNKKKVRQKKNYNKLLINLIIKVYKLNLF